MSEALNDRLVGIVETEIAGVQPLHGGSIAKVLRIDLVSGDRLVVKLPARESDANFDIEAWMLETLRETRTVPVPSVVHVEKDLLLLDWIDHQTGPPSSAAQHDAAERIAALHNISGQAHGYERDTVLGPLPQPNPVTGSWVEFFRDHRLLRMAGLARDGGSLPSFTFERIEDLATKLDELLREPDQPSLLHGDLWAGNILFGGGRLQAVLDPAIYRGHPEMELAHMTLFGPFDTIFFDRYAEIRGIEPDFFEVRRRIYTLYPLLVHLHLFGRTYLPPIAKILDRHRRR